MLNYKYLPLSFSFLTRKNIFLNLKMAQVKCAVNVALGTGSFGHSDSVGVGGLTGDKVPLHSLC